MFADGDSVRGGVLIQKEVQRGVSLKDVENSSAGVSQEKPDAKLEKGLRGFRPIALLSVFSKLWKAEEKWKARGWELPVGGETDNEYVLRGMTWDVNYWLLCDNKERLVELLNLDMEHKPEWWTCTKMRILQR